MKKLAALILSIWFLGSCDFIDPDMSNFSNFKLGKLEGKTLNISFDAKITNENGYGIKVKNGNLKVTVNDLDIGTIDMTQKIKLKRKSSNVYNVPLKLTLSDGALFRIMKLVDESKFNLKLDGTIRGSILGVGKTIDVHQKRSLSKESLNLDGLLEGVMKVFKNN